MKLGASSLILATVTTILLASGAAEAQSITAAVQINPERFTPNGQDLGQSTRPVNLNPTGINYADCIQDMQFVYSVTLSGFPGAASDNMQVWATNQGDCTNDTTRGLGGTSSVQAACWLVNQGLT